MARDYKHRADPAGQELKPRKPRVPKKRKLASKSAPRVTTRVTANKPSVPLWRWALVFSLVSLFAYFLYSLSLSQKSPKPTPIATPVRQQVKALEVKKPPEKIKPVTKPETPKNIKEPVKEKIKPEAHFDFYTILPKAEFVVPDYEVKTRKREERLGKEKTGVEYTVQVGSFRSYNDADSLKAKLLLMGFSPKIEKAVVGSVTWHRVKMGPYKYLASVDAIQSRLKEKNIDALVMEVKN